MRHGKFKQRLEECGGNKIKALALTHWPSFIAGCATSAFIVLAERLNLKEIAIIGSIAAGLVSQRERTEEAIRDLYGEEGLEKIRVATDEKIAEHYFRSAGPSVEETGRGDLLCYEKYSGRWFRSCENAVEVGMKEFKNDYDGYMPLSYNNLYFELGITETTFGDRFGYPTDHEFYGDVPFQYQLKMFETGSFKLGNNMYNDEPILVIDVETLPMEWWGDAQAILLTDTTSRRMEFYD